jgi:hypothetical protein
LVIKVRGTRKPSALARRSWGNFGGRVVDPSRRVDRRWISEKLVGLLENDGAGRIVDNGLGQRRLPRLAVPYRACLCRIDVRPAPGVAKQNLEGAIVRHDRIVIVKVVGIQTEERNSSRLENPDDMIRMRIKLAGDDEDRWP